MPVGPTCPNEEIFVSVRMVTRICQHALAFYRFTISATVECSHTSWLDGQRYLSDRQPMDGDGHLFTLPHP